MIMKLSDNHRFRSLLAERERLRESMGCALGDEDIRVSIRGSEAQGAVRQACVAAIAALYETDLRANTEALQGLGVDVDDRPVEPRPKVDRRLAR